MTGHVLGTPFWVEIATPDVAASRGFYGELFGWYCYTLAIGEYGDYAVFTLGDVQGPEVGGMQPLADDTQPPSWTCYFYTDDMDATLGAVRAAGGLELMEPATVADLGRAVLCADTQGAGFALWEPRDPGRVPVADEPATMCWVELASRDVRESRRFYGEVFGWTAVDRRYRGSVYTTWKVGDWAAAGMVPMDERWPPDYPAHWIPYFKMPDCDASAARAAELGAKVRVPPSDVEAGRLAILTDPTGARFAVYTPDAGARERFGPRR
ncbi:VOC family protein [Actinomadura chokoriensis]|uniref:VOC family protein n=1 Tax=Actinomadura chokoriensis TaxID=454156 RepID=UPI0031F8AFCC